jgi:hypothetical protein
MNFSIYNFLCSTHPDGRSGFTDDGWQHYMTILPIIYEKIFNPDKPESNFVTQEKWEHAKAVADTRNKEGIEYCDLFRKFVESVKQTPEYIQFTRERKLNQIIEND